jgi:hypothetical protein
MKGKTLFHMLCLIAALALVPVANAAVTVHFIGVGSSAMFQAMAVAAVNDPGLAGAGSHHYTISGNCSSGPCAKIHEQRGTPGQIPDESGNVWLVWNNAQTEAWAYLSVDSVVGNRAYFANPRPLLQLDPDTNNGTKHGANLISPFLFLNGDTTADASCLGQTSCDALNIPNAIYLAITGQQITAGLTDIRPEDAQFAQVRVTKALNATTAVGLGYTMTNNVGIPIKSSFSGSSQATPVNFSIKGKDPITLNTVKKYVVTPVGAAPIVFIANRGGVLASLTDATEDQLHTVFSGTNCSTTALGLGGGSSPVTAILREPLSGTMNTTEYSVFRLYTSTAIPKLSQEKNVGAPTVGTSANPLSTAGGVHDGGKPCLAGGGHRYRAIGTGQMVNGASGVGGVKQEPDSIGYAFFSFGNISGIADASHGYIKLDGIDPIFNSYGGGDPGQIGGGRLPTCDTALNGSPGGCRASDVWTAGNSYPHLRDGSYRAWSILRVVSDPPIGQTGGTQAGSDAITLATTARNFVDNTVADFVSFSALNVYRSHFKLPKMAVGGPSNNPEIGGDMGGCIFSDPPVNDAAHLNRHQPKNAIAPPPDAPNCIVKAGLN